MITKRNETQERGSNRPSAHRGRWGDLARRMAAILTATALGLGITVYGADKYAPVQITDPSQFPTIKIETNLVLDEATELPANVTIDGTTYGFVEVGLRVTRGAAPYDMLSYVGVVVSYNNEHLKPITWTNRDAKEWTPADDTKVEPDPDTGEETTVDAQNFRFLAEGEKYLPAKKADIMDTAAARIIGEEDGGWTAFTMVAACDDEVTLTGDSRLMVVRFAYEQTDDFELTYDTTDNKIKKVVTRDEATGAVTSTEDVPLLQWATDDSVSLSPQAENSAMLVGTNDENTVYYAHNDPNPATWTVGDSGLPEPNTQGYKDYAIPADGESTASMLTASAVELPDEPSTVYDTGDDTVYDLTDDTEPESPEDEPMLYGSNGGMALFATLNAPPAGSSFSTNFFPVDPDYIAGLNDGSITWPWSVPKSDANKIDAPKIQFVDIHRPTADSGVGGISLDDVVPVIFFDWDDTFLGATVIARGIDGRENVNDFVKENLIHPDLRESFRSGGSLAREFSYRGVEPHKGPGEGDTVTDGEQYPLTNKLDYVFYGDPDDVDPYLFDDGWVWVDSALDVQNTWTTLGVGELTYAKGDAAGLEVALAKLKLFDFKTDVETINNNISSIYVKAVYEPGASLDNGTIDWYKLGEESYYRYGVSAAYGISIEYDRKNEFGYGTRRIVEPALEVVYDTGVEADGETISFSMEFTPTGVNTLAVEILAAKEIKNLSYVLHDKYNSNFVDGNTRSGADLWGTFTNYDYSTGTGVQGSDGFVKDCTVAWFAEYVQAYESGDVSGDAYFDLNTVKDCNFRSNANGTAFAARTYTNARKNVQALMTTRRLAGKEEPVSWYELQYAIITKDGTDIGEAAAKAWLDANVASPWF